MKVKLCQGIRHTAVMNHGVQRNNSTISSFSIGVLWLCSSEPIFSLYIETDNVCSMNGDNFAI